MSTPQFSLLLFLFFLGPAILEMLGFNWKSTEASTYLLGICAGTIIGWWIPI